MFTLYVHCLSAHALRTRKISRNEGGYANNSLSQPFATLGEIQMIILHLGVGVEGVDFCIKCVRLGGGGGGGGDLHLCHIICTFKLLWREKLQLDLNNSSKRQVTAWHWQFLWACTSVCKHILNQSLPIFLLLSFSLKSGLNCKMIRSKQ